MYKSRVSIKHKFRYEAYLTFIYRTSMMSEASVRITATFATPLLDGSANI